MAQQELESWARCLAAPHLRRFLFLHQQNVSLECVWMAALVCGFVRFHAVISSSEVFVTLARHAMQLWFWYMCSEYHESGVGRLFLYWSSSVRWGFAIPSPVCSPSVALVRFCRAGAMQMKFRQLQSACAARFALCGVG